MSKLKDERAIASGVDGKPFPWLMPYILFLVYELTVNSDHDLVGDVGKAYNDGKRLSLATIHDIICIFCSGRWWEEQCLLNLKVNLIADRKFTNNCRRHY